MRNLPECSNTDLNKKRRNELTFTSISSRASTTEEQLPYFKSEKKTLEIAIQHESVYCKR